jgi:ATP-dependent DNA helicase RecQ
MHGYILTDTCREVYLRNYFGDTDAKPCGHCDNCLKSAATSKSDSPTSTEIQEVFELIEAEEKTLVQLYGLIGQSKQKVQQCIQFLIREEKITTNPTKPGYYRVA